MDPKQIVECVATTQYRQKAGLLAAKANSLLISDGLFVGSLLASNQVTQHLFGQGRHPGYVPSSLITETASGSLSLESSSLASVPEISGLNRSVGAASDSVYLPCCHSCGAPLQPGYNQTSIRLVSSPACSRSQRRRASRMKARLNKQIISKNNATAATAHASRLSNLGKFTTAPLALVDSTIYKNYLLLSCGSCKASYQIPGLARKQLTQGSSTSKTKAKQLPIDSSKKRWSSQKKPAVSSKETEEFISLPLAAKSPSPTISKPHAQRSSNRGQQRVELSRSSSKKKKKTPNKNKLMDFLSSLND